MRVRMFTLAALAALALLCCVGCAGRVSAGRGALDLAGAQPVAGEETGGAHPPQTASVTEPPVSVPAETAQAPASPAAETTEPPAGTAVRQNEPAAAPEETAAPRAEPVTKTRAIAAGSPVSDTLFTAGDEHRYVFSANERGMIRVTVSASSRQNLSSRVVEICREYYLNGVEGETGLRLLTRLDAFSANGESATPCIGIAPGRYVVRVVSGDVTALSEYTLRLDYTPRTDYEIEVNDTPSRYTELASGLQTRGSARVPETGKDTDWYLFRMYYDGALSVKFRHATGKAASTAFKVTVYNERFEPVYTGLSAFSAGTLLSGTLGVKAGFYYVCVENRVYYDGDYGLTVTATHGAGFESEPNDGPASATGLPAGFPVRAALTARDAAPDKDCFAVTLNAAGALAVSMETAGGGDAGRDAFRLTLADAAGKTLYACRMDAAETALETPAIGLPAGRYFVTVDNEDLYGTDADYTLCCRFTPDGAFETEPNDSPETADPLAPGASVTGAIADGTHGYDTDCYAFTIAAAGGAELTLAHGAALPGEIYTVELLDQTGAAVLTADGRSCVSVAGDAPETALRFALNAGAYTVRVRAGLFQYGGAYTLTLTLPQGAPQ